MTRAAYDKAVDFYSGPSTAAPNLLVASGIQARYVPDLAFVDRVVPLSSGMADLTCEDFAPSGAGVTLVGGDVYTYDYGKGHSVSLLVGGTPEWIIQRVELRSWPSGQPYYRSYLAPFVFVPPYGCEVYNAYDGTFPCARQGPFEWGNMAVLLVADGVGGWVLNPGNPTDEWVCSSWNGQGQGIFTLTVAPFTTQFVECAP